MSSRFTSSLRLPLLAGLACACLCACASAPRGPLDPWSEVTSPAPGAAHSIGTTSAGCLTGAVSLPPDGPGFQLMRLTRRRFYGHPLLLSYLRSLGARVAEGGMAPLLIGDLGQPRGGPALTGHRSHQTGIDVDIWYLRSPEARTRSLTLGERESLGAVSLVSPGGSSVDEGVWIPEHLRLLRLAASFPEVERIFVNPAIKKYLCAHETDRAWLRVLRPWYGHDDHFHVRLRCPEADAASGACSSAADPLPPGDSCDATLDWWFSDEARGKGRTAEAAPFKLPKLPAACAEVLREGPLPEKSAGL